MTIAYDVERVFAKRVLGSREEPPEGDMARAAVVVNGETVGEIGAGMLVLLGVMDGDVATSVARVRAARDALEGEARGGRWHGCRTRWRSRRGLGR